MHFVKVNTIDQAEKILFDDIQSALAKYKKVTWLISGGSNIQLAASIFNKFNSAALLKLTIMLVDERFGSLGHRDSNYYQLQQAGIDFNKVKNYPVIKSDNQDQVETVETYNNCVQKVFSESDFIIGQFGIGADGHTAGILPHSFATEPTQELVVGYDAPDFNRITLSFEGIKKISMALIFAFGANKETAITALHDKDLSLAEQPAQIFKQVSDAYIINGMIGDQK